MIKRGANGFILASAIGVLLTISIVAAALVGASSNAMSRVRRSEAGARQDAALQSAFTLLSSQLALDPRRRAIDIAGEISLSVLDHPVRARISWESNKLDVNHGDIDAIARLMKDRDVSPMMSSAVLADLNRARNEKHPLRLLSDLGLDDRDEACASAMLTVFSGRRDYEPATARDAGLIGRPAAGSRLMLELSIPQPARAGLAVVVVISGDARRPVEVLDWKRTSGPVGEEACHDVQ